MAFTFTKNTATADGACTVEDALPLLEFFQVHRAAKVDLGPCTQMHTAVLQVLLAVRPKIAVLPREAFLARWLVPLFAQPGKKATK